MISLLDKALLIKIYVTPTSIITNDSAEAASMTRLFEGGYIEDTAKHLRTTAKGKCLVEAIRELLEPEISWSMPKPAVAG